MMKIEEILKEIKYYDKGVFPLKALKAAERQQEEITPHLLDILQDCIDNTNEYLDNDKPLMWHIYAVFLLAQFKEKKA